MHNNKQLNMFTTLGCKKKKPAGAGEKSRLTIIEIIAVPHINYHPSRKQLNIVQ